MSVSDYKSDKAIEHLAGAQEMLGLCLTLMKGSSIRDALAAFESAQHKYRDFGKQKLSWSNRVVVSTLVFHLLLGDRRRSTQAALYAADSCLTATNRTKVLNVLRYFYSCLYA